MGTGVYFTGGGLGGDASGAGCGGGEVVDVQQDVGQTDAGIDAKVAELAAWEAADLADPAKRADLDAKIAEVVGYGEDALPSLVNVIQNQACNEVTSVHLVSAIYEVLVATDGVPTGADGIANVLVTAASQGLSDFGTPLPDRSFSNYAQFDALAADLMNASAGADLPAIKEWTGSRANWSEVAEDHDVIQCSLRALDATIVLQDAATLDRLTQAIDHFPVGHPSGRYLVEAAIELQGAAPNFNESLMQIALNEQLHVSARAAACAAVNWDTAGSKRLGDQMAALNGEQLAAMAAGCDVLHHAPEVVESLADKLAEAPSVYIRGGLTAGDIIEQEDASVATLMDLILGGGGVVSETPICQTAGIYCDFGSLTTAAEALFELVEEDESAQAEFRSRLETAIVEADPEMLVRLQVLAPGADELWPTDSPIPGL